MKNLYLLALATSIIFTGCDYRTVRGNGNITTETREGYTPNRIKLAGSFDVELTQGPAASVKIEGDANLLSYVVTEQRDGFLVIKTKEHINLSSEHDIKIIITTPKLEEISLTGSGNITGNSKFTDGDRLKVSIAGSGDVSLEANTPKVEASIAGSGSITIKGETKDAVVRISGVGDYKGDSLKAENVEVHIAGSGNVKVFADAKLDVHIAGSGDVYYKGTPSITQHIAGSGGIRQMQ
ncbi:head GIN domain-containing protein [Chitinophagaceae bacterium LWZ2-11]